jgi:large subunit ribosomal protein L1
MSRSKRYKKLESKVDKTKIYDVDEAFVVLKSLASAKFDEAVEVHVRLGIDAAKADQAIRGMVSLPNGTGKTKKIAVFAESAKADEATKAGADIVGGEDLIAKIKQSGKIDFDIAVATPDMMKKMAPIAKVLGPKGLMPSPKTETVTMDIAKVVGELKKGKAEFRSDDSGNVHISIGKISFDPAKLRENFIEFLNALKNMRPATTKGEFIKGAAITTTMGPSLKVNFSVKK